MLRAFTTPLNYIHKKYIKGGADRAGSTRGLKTGLWLGLIIYQWVQQLNYNN